MAASDQNYRSQHTLDIVFALSSLAMLASIIWMFVDDYNRPFKAEQRSFRTVESALAQRQAIEQLPNKTEFEERRKTFESARADYNADATQEKLRTLKREVASMRPDRERADADFQAKKADVESITSFYNIAREHDDNKLADKYSDELKQLNQKLATSQAQRDDIAARMKEKQVQIDAIEQPMTKAQSDWKKVTDKFDTQVKVAYYKQWGWGDWFRALPIIDAFASPVKIQQVTNNDIPIDYNFKQVTRFDRCTTCHLGIDRPAYTKSNLLALTEKTAAQDKRLAEAQELLDQRTKAYEGLPEASRLPTKSQLTLTVVSKGLLTDARVNEYAAHPRLDIFVGANSKHPAEKFGCSACHSGQGSATDFTLAAHSPNNSAEREQWVKEHDWESQHMWDFPMLPQRFIESSCLKCHAEVTDLISSNNRNEAPKLLRGYNLIKENGCFGCHEIAGTKAGRVIGPDLRLEPNPPLANLTPTERTKIESDAENPPGDLRKVGPSLFRISEKTNPEWAAKWIRAPRSFRPETKMPHFYGLPNNRPDVLPEDQKKFPDAEIRSIIYYLFKASEKFVNEIAAQKAANQPAQDGNTDDERQKAFVARGVDKLSAAEKTELAGIRHRVRLRGEKVLRDAPADHPGDAKVGRQLFTERGCLACHNHVGTTKSQGESQAKDYVPAVRSEADFGPNLSQLVGKLGKTPGDKTSARKWLIQWVMDPHVHSPRSRMPVTHLTEHQAADVAAWLLDQPAQDLGVDWAETNVPEPDEQTLRNLAKVYLVRLNLPHSEIDSFLDKGTLPKEVVTDMPQDERELAEHYAADREGSLKWFLGKKAVSRLGCYACHDVPGFDNAKPIGVGLNDWGKKPADRLAFENIDNFVKKHFYPVAATTDKDGKPVAFKAEKEDGKDVVKRPYERFFYDDLMHHGRTGYLNQKILQPRSYDYGKKLAWDDRSRMPQFRFARNSQKKERESDTDFEARSWKEEAEAREAVMTFVLGLVGEQVPEKMVNTPKGDRRMEVKGRQVLDKYNCAGCHLLRPGSYDLRLTPSARKNLEEVYEFAQTQTKSQNMHVFPGHHFWTGKNPVAPDRVAVAGVYPKLVKAEGDEDDPEKPYVGVEMTLAEALRFYGNDQGSGAKVPLDVPTSVKLQFALEDLIPGVKSVKSPQELEHLLGAEAPWGGRFSDLMVSYLAKKYPETIRLTGGDSGTARAKLPPVLIGEGERTQVQWLTQFLLDPSAVRPMSILRMPKFNLSQGEARTLVDYFAAVEKITNPGIGLSFPGEDIPQQSPLDSPFWVRKNSEYLIRLKGTEGPQGYKDRVQAYEASWKQVAKLAEAAVKADVERVKQGKEQGKQLETLEAKIKKTTDATQKAVLEKEASTLKESFGFADTALKKLEETLKETGTESVRKKWLSDEAYVTDAFRLIANRKVCLQCHDVGGFPASNPATQTQGPPLALAHARLRPEWMFHWIANPQRHLPYESIMPPYFPKRKPGAAEPVPVFQDLFAGTPLEQIGAVRDTLMNYPRVIALPVNQQLNPDIPTVSPALPAEKNAEKNGDKK